MTWALATRCVPHHLAPCAAAAALSLLPPPLAQALNQVYKKLARKYHPDKNPDDPERAAARCEPLASDPVPAL